MSQQTTVTIYKMTQDFPKSETYGLISQMRRAAVSISANFAEGTGRGTDRDFARFVQMAMGSACEVECLILLSHELRYVDIQSKQTILDQIYQIKKMLTGLIKKLTAES